MVITPKLTIRKRYQPDIRDGPLELVPKKRGSDGFFFSSLILLVDCAPKNLLPRRVRKICLGGKQIYTIACLGLEINKKNSLLRKINHRPLPPMVAIGPERL